MPELTEWGYWLLGRRASTNPAPVHGHRDTQCDRLWPWSKSTAQWSRIVYS